MKRNALGAIALTIAAATVALPAAAQEATPWPDIFMTMADSNRDGMITRQEFLDQMAKVWDSKHASMMKSDRTMKPGMMDRRQFSGFAVTLLDPGKIGG